MSSVSSLGIILLYMYTHSEAEWCALHLPLAATLRWRKYFYSTVNGVSPAIHVLLCCDTEDYKFIPCCWKMLGGEVGGRGLLCSLSWSWFDLETQQSIFLTQDHSYIVSLYKGLDLKKKKKLISVNYSSHSSLEPLTHVVLKKKNCKGCTPAN